MDSRGAPPRLTVIRDMANSLPLPDVSYLHVKNVAPIMGLGDCLVACLPFEKSVWRY